MNKISCILFVFSCLTLISLHAQHNNLPNADSMFIKAREAAFSDRWPEARRIGREILLHYPDHTDARLLIGRTYAWEHKADSARMVVRPILDMEPDSHDAFTLLSDSEIWSENYDEAIKILDNALLYHPTDQDFLFKRANAFYLNGDYENAAIALQDLLNINPDHENGKYLHQVLQTPIVAELYHKADIEANAGKYEEARKLLRELLVDEPGHFPASLLIAQTYAFENKFDSARHITTELYRADPNHYDLLLLMVNIEIWDNKYKAAMTQVNTALAAHPDNAEFLYRKALIQYLQQDYRDALETLNHLLENVDPNHAEAIRLRDEILQNYRDYVFHEYYFEYAKNRINGFYTRKWITSTGLAKWTKYGTYIGKFNIGHDWGIEHRNLESVTHLSDRYYSLPAYQLEFEAYQKLWPGGTLWLNHAFRVPMHTSSFFPRHRGGLELFQRIPENFEGSAGVRYMIWEDRDDDDDIIPGSSKWIWIGTLSLSWMPNQNYFAWRVFLDFNSGSFTNIITYRRYFSDKPEYFYALVGIGTYGDEFLHLSNVTDERQRMPWLWQVGIHKFITPRWFFLAAFGANHIPPFQDRWMAQAGVRYYFNMFK